MNTAATFGEAEGRLDALRRRLGQQWAQGLFAEVASTPPREPAGISWTGLLAYGLAALVHVASLALLLAGLALLLAWSSIWWAALGAVLCLLAWATRPRFSEPPDHLLEREAAPMLHLLADRVAQAVGARPLDGLAISKDLNANYRSAGWRGRRYVELGLPLTLILSGPERIALVAHELAHGANRDPLRGNFLGTAVDSLSTWAVTLRPLAIGQAGGLVGTLSIPFELLSLAVSELIFLMARGLLMLVMRQSQKAEYLADRLAAEAAGTLAVTGMLEKFHATDAVDMAVQRHVLNGCEGSLLPVLVDAVQSLSEAELQRLREASRQSLSQVDGTHPPTALRIDMLRLHRVEPAVPLLSAQELQALDAELAGFMPRVQRELTNHYLVGIYG